MAMEGGLGELMKQAQQMQERFKALQQEMAGTEVTGESGAGLVKVVMNGRHDVKKVTIDPDVLKEEKVVLEELLAAAVNDAVRKVERSQQQKLSELTAGIPLPAGMRFPLF